MARFNEILAGRLNRALQKFTGIKASAPTPQLATEFIPVFPLFWGVENRFLEGWNRYAIFVNSPAVAAQQNGVRLLNQNIASTLSTGTTKAMVVFEKINVWNLSGAAMQVFLSYNTLGNISSIPAGGAVSVQSLDIRSGASQTSILLGTFGNAASVGIPIGGLVLPVNTGYDFIMYENQEVTLPPSAGLQLWTNVVNVPFQATIWWRERPLEESELQ